MRQAIITRHVAVFEVIKQLRAVLAFFSDSTDASNHLEHMRQTLDIKRGLESIGTTRFGTLHWSSESMIRCLPAIRKIVGDGEVDTKVKVPSAICHLLSRNLSDN
jgi:hypothetical protein